MPTTQTKMNTACSDKCSFPCPFHVRRDEPFTRPIAVDGFLVVLA
jgi:hypothetical protein